MGISEDDHFLHFLSKYGIDKSEIECKSEYHLVKIFTRKSSQESKKAMYDVIKVKLEDCEYPETKEMKDISNELQYQNSPSFDFAFNRSPYL